jgi:glycosyltransferase involved in cell wall biosynthesis
MTWTRVDEMTIAQVNASPLHQREIRVLIVTPSFPYPPHGGAELRSYHLIKRLSQQYKISLVALTDPIDHRFVKQMRDYCEEVVVVVRRRLPPWRQLPSLARLLLSGMPFGTKYYNDPLLFRTLNEMLTRRSYDILQIEQSPVACVIRALAADQLGNTRTLLTFYDVHHVRDRSMSTIERKPYDFMTAMINRVSMKAWERAMTAEFDACIAVSADDSEALKSLRSDVTVFTVPNGVDTHVLTILPPAKNSRTLLFVGDCNYLPNRDGVLWFYRHIFGALRDSVTDIRLVIVGKGSDHWLCHLADNPCVFVTGHVDDVVAFYERAAISIVPLRAGGGTRLKILESMALGRPVVSTSMGAQGLKVTDGQDILIADEPDRFAECVIKLLRDPILCQRLITNARRLVVAEYDWDAIAGTHSEIYQRLASWNSASLGNRRC